MIGTFIILSTIVRDIISLLLLQILTVFCDVHCNVCMHWYQVYLQCTITHSLKLE